MSYTFENWFRTKEPSIHDRQAAAVLELTKEGATVPFISRYRKEKTGNLDEVQIQKVIDLNDEWKEILKRQSYILSEIEKQGQLSEELKAKIQNSFELEKLEDLYLPYKKKKKTKAAAAKELGLEPLALKIWAIGQGENQAEAAAFNLEADAKALIAADKGLDTVEKVLEGCRDILVEKLSEDLDLREFTRKMLFSEGYLYSKKTSKAKTPSKYDRYFDYQERIASLKLAKNTHRYLALRRGWEEEELALSIDGGPNDAEFEGELLAAFERKACPKTTGPLAAVEFLKGVAKLSLHVYVKSSIDNEVHTALKKESDQAAIHVFSENIKKVLLSPPLGSQTVLGVDPGIRTGCKLALVDETGTFKGTHVVHLQSDKEKENASKLLQEVCKQLNVKAIAVGNGTAGRETESFIRKSLKDSGMPDIPVIMVNESGASVYSASAVAREEFPDLDVTVRGAISIARRLQDPLAELVKVDPKSIGVGQYQHDVSQPELRKSLENVVDSCVNRVGVDLNTASKHLLSRVSGIGQGLAAALVEHRSKKGLFTSREDLLAIPRFSKKTFELSAGFLRIRNGKNPLDNTGVHPERYEILITIARKKGKELNDLLGAGSQLLKEDSELKKEIGEFTFADIVNELEKPGRDPRDQFVPFAFREDIHEMKDLVVGMICNGLVTNVTNFGAFVDIGVHQDGLVHLSQMAQSYVKDPREILSPGDAVKVKVLEVNLEKKQISLTLRTEERPVAPPSRDNRDERPRPPRDEGNRPRHSQNRSPRDPRENNRANPSASAGGPPRAPQNRQPQQQQSVGAPPGAAQERPMRDNRDQRPRQDWANTRPQVPRPTSHKGALTSNPFAQLKDVFTKKK